MESVLNDNLRYVSIVASSVLNKLYLPVLIQSSKQNVETQVLIALHVPNYALSDLHGADGN